MSSIQDWRINVCEFPHPPWNPLYLCKSRDTIADLTENVITGDPTARRTRSTTTSTSAPYEASDFRRMILPDFDIEMEDTIDYEAVFPAEITSHISPFEQVMKSLLRNPTTDTYPGIKEALDGNADGQDVACFAERVVDSAKEVSHKGKEQEKNWKSFWETVYAPLKAHQSISMESDFEWSNKISPLNDEPGDFKAKTCSFEKNTKPDIAFGLKFFVKPRDLSSPVADPFLKCWVKSGKIHGPQLKLLENHPDARLHARPSMSELVYPCLIHEIKSGQVSLTIAANQVSLSLAYALDQQEELRRLAGAVVEERMPIFGVASSNAFATIWYGAYVGDEIQLVQSESIFMMTKPRQAAAFILFMNKWREWVLNTHGPRIVKWLDLLRQATRPGSNVTRRANSSSTEMPA